MHEPSSRRLSRHEPSVGWKTVSVEGHRDFEKQVLGPRPQEFFAMEVPVAHLPLSRNGSKELGTRLT